VTRPAERQLVVERHIAADAATVFSFFTDRDRWLSWQGVEAEIDPRPGGAFRMNVRGDGVAAGRFVVVEPHRRIVFTWGWEIEGGPLPPGGSTVEIELIPTDDGTLVRLTHWRLPPELFEAHREGWTHYLDRLVIRAGGDDPGPDPAVVISR
jgi:uncharacterized protein YndB with AHSA1/START domain